MTSTNNTKIICEYCQDKFSNETYRKHKCNKKTRWLIKETKESVIAFIAFKKHQQSLRPKAKERQFIDFVNNRYYNSYLKFGMFVTANNPPEIENFIQYLITNKIPLAKWAKDINHTNYINYLLVNEKPEQGIMRSYRFIEKLMEPTEKPANKFFEDFNHVDILNYFRYGRLSPWILYSTDLVGPFVDRLTAEQLQLLDNYSKTEVWRGKLKVHAKKIEEYRQLAKSIGL